MERAAYGRSWSLEELTLGLVGDIGDLAKLVQAREGVRKIDDVQTRLEHELADLLWATIVIAEQCGVDLERAFLPRWISWGRNCEREPLLPTG